MNGSRLNWKRGRQEEGAGVSPRTLEWVGYDNAGEPIARVVRVQGPVSTGWRRFHAVARDKAARVVELRPEGRGWLACVGARVIARAERPMEAVRAVEAVLKDGAPPQIPPGERPPGPRSVGGTLEGGARGSPAPPPPKSPQ